MSTHAHTPHGAAQRPQTRPGASSQPSGTAPPSALYVSPEASKELYECRLALEVAQGAARHLHELAQIVQRGIDAEPGNMVDAGTARYAAGIVGTQLDVLGEMLGDVLFDLMCIGAEDRMGGAA